MPIRPSRSLAEKCSRLHQLDGDFLTIYDDEVYYAKYAFTRIESIDDAGRDTFSRLVDAGANMPLLYDCHDIYNAIRRTASAHLRTSFYFGLLKRLAPPLSVILNTASI